MAKSSPNHPSKTQQKPTFRPLSIEQKNAIDQLITGATDAEVAAAVGVDRSTVVVARLDRRTVTATGEQEARLLEALPHGGHPVRQSAAREPEGHRGGAVVAPVAPALDVGGNPGVQVQAREGGA